MKLYTIVKIWLFVIFLGGFVLAITGDFKRMASETNEYCRAIGYDGGMLTFPPGGKCYNILPEGWMRKID